MHIRVKKKMNKKNILWNLLLIVLVILIIITTISVVSYLSINVDSVISNIVSIAFGIIGVAGSLNIGKMINDLRKMNAKSYRNLNEFSNKEARIDRYRKFFLEEMRKGALGYLLLEQFVINILNWTGKMPDYSHNELKGYQIILFVFIYINSVYLY